MLLIEEKLNGKIIKEESRYSTWGKDK